MEKGKIPKVANFFLDSPMAIKCHKAYQDFHARSIKLNAVLEEFGIIILLNTPQPFIINQKTGANPNP